MRQDRTADFLTDAALGKNRLAFSRMIRQVGMNLPIEVVQQRRDRPLLLILARFARIRGDACLDRQHVLSQIIRLDELAHDLPRLIPVHKMSVYAHAPRTPSAVARLSGSL